MYVHMYKCYIQRDYLAGFFFVHLKTEKNILTFQINSISKKESRAIFPFLSFLL